ncbi:glutathione S-transferase family protein [Oricola thermophila]|uniref:Glutathione S-transferase family protein n=1 Tax=Oricola thermophila TaxID=2742145 RepID=A0A6N1VCQ1_9HYPH|nr:glutathione S-transferase family protein [Oricola thermophila]QKV18680.1 glutathione S-transferase family protein [Oricola thermophila]
MSERIQFYTNPMSRGQIARWALHEAGAEYDEHLLDYGPEMKGEYRSINPMGKVPAIVHDGNVVTEAAAICLYLAEAFPEAGLLPEGLSEKADYLRWTLFAAGPVEQAIIARSFKWDEGLGPREQGRVGFGSYDRVVEVLAGLLRERDYVCGDRFTAADIYVGAQVDWGLAFKTLPVLDEFVAYAGRLRARDAYRAAKAIDAAHIEAMRKDG